MKIKTATVLVLAALGAALAAASALGAPASGAVSLRSTSLGRVLVDAHGRTLYLFAADKGGKSACYGKCASFWPPLLAKGAVKPGAGVKASLLGTAKRKDGTRQVTYAGHPLYTFAEDTKAGLTKGEDTTAFGGTWWVVSAKGAKVAPTSNTSAGSTTNPTTTTDPGSGYGY